MYIIGLSIGGNQIRCEAAPPMGEYVRACRYYYAVRQPVRETAHRAVIDLGKVVAVIVNQSDACHRSDRASRVVYFCRPVFRDHILAGYL